MVTILSGEGLMVAELGCDCSVFRFVVDVPAVCGSGDEYDFLRRWYVSCGEVLLAERGEDIRRRVVMTRCRQGPENVSAVGNLK